MRVWGEAAVVSARSLLGAGGWERDTEAHT